MATPLRFLTIARILAITCALAAGTSGCGDDEKAQGSIRIAISTDVRTPLTFDGLHVEVRRSGTPIFTNDAGYELVTTLPNSLVVVEEPGLDEASREDAITVVVEGKKGEELVLSRIASLNFSDGAVLLRMPLCGACLNVECTNGRTCKAGECVGPEVDEASLPADDGAQPLTDAECPVPVPRCEGKCGEPECGACPTVEAVDIQGSFRIDATEVTREAYEAWLDANPHPAETGSGCALATAYYPSTECLADPGVCTGAGCEQHPQVCVQWCAAQDYCAWAGKRLCGDTGGAPLPFEGSVVSVTEGEWYMACGGPGGQTYPYGSSYANDTCNDDTTTTEAVKSNPLCVGGVPGLYDMSGNVTEWENSCDDTMCKARGGAYGEFTLATCSYSFPYDKNAGDPKVGFRCCSSP